MRTTKVLSISLPPQLLAEAEKLAKEENRTVSELFREALRRYQQQKRWDEINAYGRAKAEELGITEEDVVPIIQQFRKEQRQKAKGKRPQD